MIFGAENSIQLARFRAVALAEDTLLCKAKQRRVAGFQPTRKRMSPGKQPFAPLAQLAEQVTLNHWVAGSIPARCRISWLIDVFLRDRHLAADTEGSAGDLQSGRGLFALVFVEIDAALHPAYGFFAKSPGDDV